MNIAIIISAHGELSQQFLKTSEMIVGKQKNVECINFMTGESTEFLNKKMNESIEKLNIQDGLLFFVDMWGGSPFNVASQICHKYDNFHIITGVNVPILTEVFMIRDEYQSIRKITEVIIEIGKNSIKSLIPYTKKEEIKKVNLLNQGNLNHKQKNMNICFVRIDDRLIHGQVVTNWIKEIRPNRIIVVNDEIACDSIRKKILIQLSPTHIYTHVVSIEKLARAYKNPKYFKDRIMLLFTNPFDVLKTIKKGIKISDVNIGGMSFSKGKIQVSDAISLNIKDIESFKKLHELNVNLEVRKISNDSPLDLIKILKDKKLYKF